MARGRFISNTLGRSKKYNQLPDDFTKLVYIHTLTNADERGRIEADPIAIYGDHFVVHPDASLDRIETALQELHRVGLIVLYEVEKKRYAQFADFEVHNKIRRDENDNPVREGRSKIPAPPNASADTAQGPRSLSAKTVSKGLRVKGQEQSVKSEGKDPPLHSSEERMARAFETGQPQANEEHRVRAEVTRLAGRDFTRRYKDDLPSWTRWTNEQLRLLWDKSDPNKWPGERDKKRAWIFYDLLQQDRPAYGLHDTPTTDYESTADMRARIERELGVN